MSDLVKWFQRRRETRALESIQQHLALTTAIVDDLERAIAASIGENEKEMLSRVQRVTDSEREADALRRRIMDEISKGELASADRADLMDLVKRVDTVADWNRESTRILGAIPMRQVPESIQKQFVEFINGAKGCTVLLQKCINRMMTKPEEALQAADEVEREEEKVDDIHEKARRLLGKEDLPRAGVAVLISQLFETMEAIADACEDACDQVRVIMIRK